MSAQEWARRHPELAAELADLDSSEPASSPDDGEERDEVVVLVHPPSFAELVGALAWWSVALLVLLLGQFVWSWDSPWLLVACGAVGLAVAGALLETAAEIARRLWRAGSH